LKLRAVRVVAFAQCSQKNGNTVLLWLSG